MIISHIYRKDIKTLSPNDSVKLWLKGRSQWNEFFEDNPYMHIDFRDVDFSKYREKYGLEEISFKGYRFPNGNKLFTSTNFGDGDTTFAGVDFGSGQVQFTGAKFGKGELFFSNLLVQEGDTFFDQAQFECTKIVFGWSKFGGDLTFHYAKFGKCIVLMRNMKVNGLLAFADLKNAELIEEFDLKHSQINGSLDLSKLHLKCIIGLTHTSVKNHISLSGLSWHLSRQGKIIKKVNDQNTATRLLRLKQIAKSNEDYALELKLFADECRSRRWNSYSKSWSAIDLIYSALSDYGQSILRPVFLLFFMLILTMYLTAFAASELNSKLVLCSLNEDKIISLTNYSIVNALPFIPNAQNIREASKKNLFCSATNATKTSKSVPQWLQLWSIFLGIFSFFSLFLTGLSLRNRFRL
ncbi:MAG: hypothetical protein AB7S65_01030 [Sulfuricurvum sp.]